MASTVSFARRSDSPTSSTCRWRWMAPSTRAARPSPSDGSAGASSSPGAGSASPSRMFRRKRRANPSRPSYQSWLPGIPSSTRRRPSSPRVRRTRFHGLTRRRSSSSAVAAGYAVSPPKSRMSPRGSTREASAASAVLGEEHARPPPRSRRGRRRCRRRSRSRPGARAAPPGWRRRPRRPRTSRPAPAGRGAVRPHPVAQVELVAGGGDGRQVAEVTDQRRHAEPADRERRVGAPPEGSEAIRRLPRRERLHVGARLSSGAARIRRQPRRLGYGRRGASAADPWIEGAVRTRDGRVATRESAADRIAGAAVREVTRLPLSAGTRASRRGPRRLPRPARQNDSAASESHARTVGDRTRTA